MPPAQRRRASVAQAQAVVWATRATDRMRCALDMPRLADHSSGAARRMVASRVVGLSVLAAASSKHLVLLLKFTCENNEDKEIKPNS